MSGIYPPRQSPAYADSAPLRPAGSGPRVVGQACRAGTNAPVRPISRGLSDRRTAHAGVEGNRSLDNLDRDEPNHVGFRTTDEKGNGGCKIRGNGYPPAVARERLSRHLDRAV